MRVMTRTANALVGIDQVYKRENDSQKNQARMLWFVFPCPVPNVKSEGPTLGMTWGSSGVSSPMSYIMISGVGVPGIRDGDEAAARSGEAVVPCNSWGEFRTSAVTCSKSLSNAYFVISLQLARLSF